MAVGRVQHLNWQWQYTWVFIAIWAIHLIHCFRLVVRSFVRLFVYIHICPFFRSPHYYTLAGSTASFIGMNTIGFQPPRCCFCCGCFFVLRRAHWVERWCFSLHIFLLFHRNDKYILYVWHTGTHSIFHSACTPLTVICSAARTIAFWEKQSNAKMK